MSVLRNLRAMFFGRGRLVSEIRQIQDWAICRANIFSQIEVMIQVIPALNARFESGDFDGHFDEVIELYNEWLENIDQEIATLDALVGALPPPPPLRVVAHLNASLAGAYDGTPALRNRAVQLVETCRKLVDAVLVGEPYRALLFSNLARESSIIMLRGESQAALAYVAATQKWNPANHNLRIRGLLMQAMALCLEGANLAVEHNDVVGGLPQWKEAEIKTGEAVREISGSASGLARLRAMRGLQRAGAALSADELAANFQRVFEIYGLVLQALKGTIIAVRVCPNLSDMDRTLAREFKRIEAYDAELVCLRRSRLGQDG